MWPFRKKSISQPIASKSFETVICIPGTWTVRDEFILAIVAATNGEYIAVGNILMHAKSKTHYTIEFCERDEKMKEAFRYAGMVTGITEECLNNIDAHKSVIYISGPTGNIEAAKHIAFAAQAILNSGGIGIKIETAGKAFEKEKWDALIENFEEPNLHHMFVVDSIIDKDGTVYSCGMQNLGCKDTIVSGIEFQQAASLISIFGYYQLVDKPVIQNGQTFSIDTTSPKYTIINETVQPNTGDNLFENPFGMWRLEKENP